MVVVEVLVAIDVMFVFIVVINPVMQGLEDALNLPQSKLPIKKISKYINLFLISSLQNY